MLESSVNLHLVLTWEVLTVLHLQYCIISPVKLIHNLLIFPTNYCLSIWLPLTACDMLARSQVMLDANSLSFSLVELFGHDSFFFPLFLVMYVLLASLFGCMRLVRLYIHTRIVFIIVLNGKVMRKVGVEVVGLGALKLTGFLRELMQKNNLNFESLYTVRTLKEVLLLSVWHFRLWLLNKYHHFMGLSYFVLIFLIGYIRVDMDQNNDK